MNSAIYPGSFDPVTNGHLNLITRGLGLFDRLIVAVAQNTQKGALFSPEERVDLLKRCLDNEPRVEVATFNGLLVDYAVQRGVKTVLRGLRAVSDFEYEFQMAAMNRKLSPTIETIFMMTGEDHYYISSGLVREVAKLGGPVDALVPPVVQERLTAMFRPAHR
jgi:pantetheine-phosphate adenylyltransferase